MGLGFRQACGERYKRASLSSPFLKKWGSRMKSVIRMSLNRWCDRKPGWDLIFGKPAGRDMRGLPSQVPFWRNGVLEWNRLLECFWICDPKGNRGDGWFLASLQGRDMRGLPSQVPFWRNEIFEWSRLLECSWICYPKGSRSDGWFSASLPGRRCERASLFFYTFSVLSGVASDGCVKIQTRWPFLSILSVPDNIR